MIYKRKRFEWPSLFYLLNLIVPAVLLFVLIYALNSGLLGRAAMLFYGPESLTILGRRVLSTDAFLSVFVYGKDFLLGYTLFSAMALLFRDSLKSILRALELALLFEVAFELLLYFLNPALPFSLTNLLAQVLGTLCSCLVFLLFSRKLI